MRNPVSRWMGGVNIYLGPLGTLRLTWPVERLEAHPRNWQCGRCKKWMRVRQMDSNGRCPRCGGPVRRIERVT